MKYLRSLILIATAGSLVLAAGCSSDATATKEEEQHFRSPSMTRPGGSMPTAPPAGATGAANAPK